MSTSESDSRAIRRSPFSGARRVFASIIVLTFLLSTLPAVTANPIETYAFEKVWWRTDRPVVEGRVDRTWIWGPEPISGLLLEPYAEGRVADRDGVRWAQYFDKTRVEITRSDNDSDNDWYVTNGLVAQELISGRIQLGDGKWATYEPADINIAGDRGDSNAPTYRSLNQVLDAEPGDPSGFVVDRIDRSGDVTADDQLATYGVTPAELVEETNHRVASVFWDFMNSEGLIYDGWEYRDDRLFEDPFFATGLPLTEAYWARVTVGGEERDVLIQAFERRILTYTPSNPDGWKIEAGNVGRHNFQWRYHAEEGDAVQAERISVQQDLSGNWRFHGEAVNQTRAAYADIEVTITTFDRDHQPVDKESTYLDSSLIEPGERVPFQVWFDSDRAFDSYEVKIESRPSARFNRTDLEPTDIQADWASDQRYEVSGRIKNTTGDTAEYVQYVVALYDKNGGVVAYHWGMIDSVNLAPGESAQFTASFYAPPEFTDYRVVLTE